MSLFSRRFTALKQYSDDVNAVISQLLRVRAVSFHSHTLTHSRLLSRYETLMIAANLILQIWWVRFYCYNVNTLIDPCSDNISWAINHMLCQTLSVMVLSLVGLRDGASYGISNVDYKRLHLRRLITFPFSQRVADRLYGVYKVHGNYGRVFR